MVNLGTKATYALATRPLTVPSFTALAVLFPDCQKMTYVKQQIYFFLNCQKSNIVTTVGARLVPDKAVYSRTVSSGTKRGQSVSSAQEDSTMKHGALGARQSVQGYAMHLYTLY